MWSDEHIALLQRIQELEANQEKLQRQLVEHDALISRLENALEGHLDEEGIHTGSHWTWPHYAAAE